jgi:hypothetical protein
VVEVSAFVEHGLCQHKAENLTVALALALSCIGATASKADEEAAIASFKTGEPVWRGGVLLVGGER